VLVIIRYGAPRARSGHVIGTANINVSKQKVTIFECDTTNLHYSLIQYSGHQEHRCDVILASSSSIRTTIWRRKIDKSKCLLYVAYIWHIDLQPGWSDLAALLFRLQATCRRAERAGSWKVSRFLTAKWSRGCYNLSVMRKGAVACGSSTARFFILDIVYSALRSVFQCQVTFHGKYTSHIPCLFAFLKVAFFYNYYIYLWYSTQVQSFITS